jgi:Zn ribbon nucleic-acid-binding protein
MTHKYCPNCGAFTKHKLNQGIKMSSVSYEVCVECGHKKDFAENYKKVLATVETGKL